MGHSVPLPSLLPCALLDPSGLAAFLCSLNASIDEKPDEKWLLFDSPVDTLWIESMNSVMDDNKVLTLINSERIAMPPQVWF